MDFIRREYGSDAATAAMGLVLQHVGDGALTEDSLGDGLVAALKFIDTNLGIAAGDAVMAEFNGALNTAINRYFENGVEEEFVAVESTAGAADTLAQAVADADESGESDAVSPEEGLMAMLRELAVRREAENAAGQATAATPYAATASAGLQTTGLLVDAAV
jgi:hypothetical protein